MIEKFSVHPSGRKMEFFHDSKPLKDICPCLRAVDYKAPHCAWKIVYVDDETDIDNRE